jgi:putative DNA primase/helicase
MTKPPLSQLAKGKWQAILPALGVGKEYLTGKHGPCPICQDGRDRFRFDNKDGRGTYFCSQCGSGDGIELVKKVHGWDFRQAAPEIEKLLPGAQAIQIRHGRDIDVVREEMNTIWRQAKPLADVPATARWWDRRVGEVPVTPELRAIRSLLCTGYNDHPAMVARIRDPEGKPCSLHRTYLTSDGEKAAVGEARRVMDIQLPKGCAVRLHEVTDVLGVAEGIETAWACWLMFEVPTWALLNAGNMKGFVPPPEVRRSRRQLHLCHPRRPRRQLHRPAP